MISSKELTFNPPISSDFSGVFSVPLKFNESAADFTFTTLIPICKRRVGLITGTVVAMTAGAGVYSSLQTPQYEGKFLLLVEPVQTKKEENLLLFDDKMPLKMPVASLDYESQMQVLWSPRIINPLVEELKTKYPEISYQYLFNKNFSGEEVLSITRQKKTKVIEVRYRSSDPKKLKFVLETVAKGYLKYSLEDRKSDSRKAVDYIEQQLPSLQKRVDEHQQKIQQFRQKYNFIDAQVQGQQLAQQLSNVNQQRFLVEGELKQYQKLAAILQDRLQMSADEALNAAALTQAPAYQNLLKQLQEIELNIVKESGRFTDNAPHLQLLRQKQQTLLNLLQQESINVLGNYTQKNLPFQDTLKLELTQQLILSLNNIQAKQIALNAVLANQVNLNKQAENFLALSREYGNLEFELRVATGTLNQLLAQRETLRLQTAKQEIPWELISPPELMEDKQGQPLAVSPNWAKNLALGGAMGLILGGIAAVLADKRDDIFYEDADLKNIVNSPILTHIPCQDNANKIDFNDAFNLLATKLFIAKFGYRVTSLTVSSAMSGDGKSTVALNLALAAAQMNKRVLLVDADLRRPQIHSRLDLDNSFGLSEAIYNNLKIPEIMNKLPKKNNLFILTAGQIPADSIRLLSSLRMEQLMQEFKQTFDIIIYDTPPLLNVADAKIIAKNTDGLLLVTRYQHTQKTALIEVLKNLTTAQLPILGLVTNR